MQALQRLQLARLHCQTVSRQHIASRRSCRDTQAWRYDCTGKCLRWPDVTARIALNCADIRMRPADHDSRGSRGHHVTANNVIVGAARLFPYGVRGGCRVDCIASNRIVGGG